MMRAIGGCARVVVEGVEAACEAVIHDADQRVIAEAGGRIAPCLEDFRQGGITATEPVVRLDELVRAGIQPREQRSVRRDGPLSGRDSPFKQGALSSEGIKARGSLSF